MSIFACETQTRKWFQRIHFEIKCWLYQNKVVEKKNDSLHTTTHCYALQASPNYDLSMSIPVPSHHRHLVSVLWWIQIPFNCLSVKARSFDRRLATQQHRDKTGFLGIVFSRWRFGFLIDRLNGRTCFLNGKNWKADRWVGAPSIWGWMGYKQVKRKVIERRETCYNEQPLTQTAKT